MLMEWTKREVAGAGDGVFDTPIKLEEGDSYEGLYLGAKQVNTRKGVATVHRFEDADGTGRSMWGGYRLNLALPGCEGKQVRVEFHGRKPTKNGNDVKVHEVFVNDGEVTVPSPSAAAPAPAWPDDDEPF